MNNTIELELVESDGQLQQVVPHNYRFIKSRLGYDIEIRDESGAWLREIRLPDDIGRTYTLDTSSIFTGVSKFDEILSTLSSYLIQNYMAGTIKEYFAGISIVTSYFLQDNNLKNSFLKSVEIARNSTQLKAIKALSEWLIVHEYVGYDYDFHSEISKLSFGGQSNQYLTLFNLDAELGPFVSEEMEILQAAIKNPHIHLEDRVILSLFIAFGLRPIQVSLLKQKDLIRSRETGLIFLNIPRVKQGQKFRREQFTKRLLSDELADMLEELIEIHRKVYADINTEDPPLIMRRTKGFIGNEHPYRLQSKSSRFFESEKSEMAQPIAMQKYQELYDSSNKSDSGYHLSNQGVTYRLQSIVGFLPNSPRTDRPFNLFPYRFRYTLGTNAVMEGKTEAEVMDLLDHSQGGSVKHYFRYTHEMNEILNEATNKRVEQQHFVAAWTREGDQTGNIYGEEIVEKKYFTSVGKCQKGSPCSFEPAVACYQCDKFCPNKDADAHKKALETLDERRQEVLDTSTGAVVHQFDSAIAGCKAAISYSEGEQIQFLEVKSGSEVMDDE